ncbi:MAG: 30S ribosomal protein S4 [Chloroflexota bacterium]|nr:30S ribosomal protein S4 [Chloroflexota bacterium]
MARYRGPVCKICRRSGEKLFLKGDRCVGPHCVVDRRATSRGSARSAARRPKVSERGLQLREKQKARYTYGVLERQFRRYFAQAKKKAEGVTGENLVQVLEARLDNVVFRLGFGKSRSQARQVVLHGHIKVNGRRVNVPSYCVRAGDVISWGEKAAKTELYRVVVEGIGDRIVPDWLSLDTQTMSGQVVGQPTREQVDARFNEKAIVEYYSR